MYKLELFPMFRKKVVWQRNFFGQFLLGNCELDRQDELGKKSIPTEDYQTVFRIGHWGAVNVVKNLQKLLFKFIKATEKFVPYGFQKKTWLFYKFNISSGMLCI